MGSGPRLLAIKLYHYPQGRSDNPRAMRGQAQGRSGTEQSKGGVIEQRSVASPTLSPGQKTRLHEIIASGNLQRVNHADFPLSAGTRVPNTVTLYDVPATIVDVLPQYSGFEYVAIRSRWRLWRFFRFDPTLTGSLNAEFQGRRRPHTLIGLRPDIAIQDEGPGSTQPGSSAEMR